MSTIQIDICHFLIFQLSNLTLQQLNSSSTARYGMPSIFKYIHIIFTLPFTQLTQLFNALGQVSTGISIKVTY